jgi:putative transposase
MPRIARAILTGYPHHVTQRGNYRQPVFEDDADRLKYLEFLNHYKRKYGLAVWAYCLMDNHIHLLCVPSADDSLANTLRDTHMRYSSYFNRRRRQQGHLWQGRYGSCICDEPHMWAAIRYIERNPVVAGLVDRAEEYRWSSAAPHVTGQPTDTLDAGLPADAPASPGDWSAWLSEEEQDADLLRRLKQNTHTGRPCGGATFIKKIETLLKRTLQPKNHGRPKKQNQ